MKTTPFLKRVALVFNPPPPIMKLSGTPLPQNMTPSGEMEQNHNWIKK